MPCRHDIHLEHQMRYGHYVRYIHYIHFGHYLHFIHHIRFMQIREGFPSAAPSRSRIEAFDELRRNHTVCLLPWRGRRLSLCRFVFTGRNPTAFLFLKCLWVSGSGHLILFRLSSTGSLADLETVKKRSGREGYSPFRKHFTLLSRLQSSAEVYFAPLPRARHFVSCPLLILLPSVVVSPHHFSSTAFRGDLELVKRFGCGPPTLDSH